MSPTASAVADAPVVATGTRFEREDMPLAQLRPSPLNPRKHFDQAGLEELAKNIREVGVLQSILVRPVGDHYEIVAGERRFRAATLAGLTTVPARVRPLTDAQALEAMVIENNQREDVNALEEADGFSRLLKGGYDLDKLTERLGRSKKYVYDRVKLLDLAAPAKELLAQRVITAGHGILLARLKPEDQLRALDVDHGGVFESEDGLTDEEEDAAEKAMDARDERAYVERAKRHAKGDARFSPRDAIGMKPKSVRETAAWIADHVRFRPHDAAAAAPLEYGDVATRVDQALLKPGRGKKVIAITFDHYIQPEARDESERTYGPRSFKFADGKAHRDYGEYKPTVAKTCEHAVLGVVAVGEHYGQVFDVCIARDKCHVHWKREIAAREKPAAAKKQLSGKSTYQEEERRRREREEKVEARWKVFLPALKKAVAEARGQLKTVTGPLYVAVLKAHHLPSTKPENLPMALLDDTLKDLFGRHYIWAGAEPRLVEWAKALGVDVKALEPKNAEQAVQTSAPKKSKTAKKAKGKK